MLIRRNLLILTAVAALMLAPNVAAAQAPFSPQTLSANNLSEADRQQIEAFVREVIAGLQSGDTVRVMTSRRIAQRELGRAEVRVPFRLDFAALATPKLAPLTRDASDFVAINTIYILGDIAAGQSALALLDCLKDEREAVRYAAVVALEDAFTASNPVPLRRGDVDVIRRQLSVQLAAEKSPKVVGAYVRMLIGAADPGRGTMPEMREVAMSLLGTAFADRVAKAAVAGQPAEPAMVDAMLQAGEALRAQLTSPQAMNIPKQQVREAARLGGMLLEYVRQRLQAGDVGAEDAPDAVRGERANLHTLGLHGEQITIFAGTLLGKSIPPTQLPALIGQQKDQEFVDGVVAQLTGPRGALTEPPFEFSDSEFVQD